MNPAVVQATPVTFVPGDVVKVHQKIVEGEKTRVQVFRGVVLGIKGRGEGRSFTVQKKVGQISVERIWPLNSPNITVEFVEHSRKKIRRAKLTYLKVPKK